MRQQPEVQRPPKPGAAGFRVRIACRDLSPQHDPDEPPMPDPIARPAVRAPGFPEMLDWINTGGRPLAIPELRGRIVILDFWTYG